jgi:hypothetical protein
MVTSLGFNWMQATIAATRQNAWYIDMFFYYGKNVNIKGRIDFFLYQKLPIFDVLY